MALRRNGYRALLLDLDGTLLDRRGELGPANRAAVRAAVDAGLEVWIATGRSVASTRRTYAALELATPACCYNGAVLYDGRSNRWLRHLALADDALAELVAFALARDLFFVIFHDDWKYTLGAATPEKAAFLDLLENVRVVERERLPRTGATRFSFAGEPSDVLAFEQMLRAHPLYAVRFPVAVIPGCEGLSFVVVDLHAPCRGKAEAIHFLEEERGIARDEVIAVGDHLNDLPMIRAAGLGVAMGNAPDEVKREADLVIGRHDEDGVARFVRALLG